MYWYHNKEKNVKNVTFVFIYFLIIIIFKFLNKTASLHYINKLTVVRQI